MPDVSKLYTAMRAFAEVFEEYDGEDELQDDVLSTLFDYHLAPKNVAKIAASAILTQESETELKTLAALTSDWISPEDAQRLYRFAVYVTKLV